VSSHTESSGKTHNSLTFLAVYAANNRVGDLDAAVRAINRWNHRPVRPITEARIMERILAEIITLSLGLDLTDMIIGTEISFIRMKTEVHTSKKEMSIWNIFRISELR
jgi:hypothetical protein